ncbi:hypothetical protein [Streptomyces sp. ID05-47C]|uniref:hypothetical protein n=1 Tax=Streptomyces sp. ID05-47C TaxID=3028665 RepID=UPI0029BAD928|nr:hypothetical protein [Streptomyces sp. ID05-47C]MDX3571947.1 hypothetical protein [Streptomyces sp. ID05-47C]
MSISYTPLHDPDGVDPLPASLAIELRLARECAERVAAADIHDHTEMVKAAAGLDYRLRALIAAVDAERGERR